MKILLNTAAKKPEIEIICVLNSDTVQEMSVAADTKIEWRNLRSELQLTDKQLTAYRDFINSAVSFIEKVGFRIVDEYQSDFSYSYYIEFEPITYEGIDNPLAGINVKFRISDHIPPKYVQHSRISEKSSGVIFKSFIVDGVTHTSLIEALKAIKNLCLDIKAGDYSKFDI